MDKKLTPEREQLSLEIDRLFHTTELSEKYRPILWQFYEGVFAALDVGHRNKDSFHSTFMLFLKLIEKQIHDPFIFQPYHAKIREPIDYYRFSLDFIRPLVDFKRSKVSGIEIVEKIATQLEQRENAVLLANHQTETDPQLISLLLEEHYPDLASRIIYVAGERVVTDPLAIPFSMGCDLLCIYSKRYINHPPELKAKKQLHNKHTMERMSKLLNEGGKIIYVAPSGGRDRRNPQGQIEVAAFDPQSIEMFYLMARKAKTPTHFYPLALATYPLLPPPERVQVELGEMRIAKFTPIALGFSPEFDMEAAKDEPDKEQRRKKRANQIWNIVNTEYHRLVQALSL